MVPEGSAKFVKTAGRGRGDTADYRSLLLGEVPLLDTRAPVEFARGAFPSATNIPLMTDDERHRVGICYRREGREAAIALGHALVAGERRQQRPARAVEGERGAERGQRQPGGGAPRGGVGQRVGSVLGLSSLKGVRRTPQRAAG